jgi:hypothetical protein
MADTTFISFQFTMTNKNIVGLALAAVLLPGVVSAATVEELQAQINALMAQLSAAKPAATASCSVVLSKSLKQGMSDAEVMSLQKALNADVATQVAASGVGSAGNETNYFGAATKAAVIKFQNKYASEVLAPAGLSTGTGFVGAATRAKINALCSGAVASTPSTTTSGTPAPSVSGLQGTAVSANVTVSSVDTDTQVNQGSSAKILGFKVEATGSDINVSNVKLTIANKGTGGSNTSNRLTRYSSKITVYMNGTAVGSANVADLTRNNDNTYSGNVALSNAVVRMGSGNKASFQVGFDALPNLDSNDANAYWTVAASEIRYTDATGVTLSTVTDPSIVTSGNYATLSGSLVKDFQFVKLATSGLVKLTLTTGSANPVAQNVKVAEASQTKAVVLNELRLKAEGSAITFNNVQVNVSASADIGTLANTLYFMKGSQQLGSLTLVAGATTSATYTIKLDSDYTMAQDNTDTFQITADLNKQMNGTTPAYAQGSTLTASIAAASSFNANDVNGDTIISSQLIGSSLGNAQAFYTAGIQASGFSASVVSANNGTNNIPSGQTFNVTYHLKAFGNTYYIPKTAVQSTSTVASTLNGLSFNLKKSGADVTGGVGVVIGSINSSANTVGNFFELPDGQDSTFTVAVTLNPMASGTAGMYSLQLNQAGYTLNSGSTGSDVQAYSFAPSQNFRTVEANIAAY